jgi:hypothetical protein
VKWTENPRGRAKFPRQGVLTNLIGTRLWEGFDDRFKEALAGTYALP